MKNQPQLCLGTVQFGLNYGITNTAGQVAEEVVGKILEESEAVGIRLLDTAQAYGNSESVLGRQLPTNHDLRLISKLPAQAQDAFTFKDVEAWERAFFDSCNRLRVQHLDSFLLHSSADLFKPGGHLLEAWLMSLRDLGLVKRLGVSIYASEDLEAVNPALLDVVQLPLSLYDQRLLQDGTVERLNAAGIAIHARSLYLQGLILTPAVQWPHWVDSDVCRHHMSLELLAQERNCSLLDFALGFAREQTHLEAVVVGLCSLKELKDMQEAWQGPSFWRNSEWRSWALQEHSILDPRRWLS